MAEVINVQGLKPFVKKMKTLGAGGFQKSIQRANKAFVADLAAKMRERAPVGSAQDYDVHPGQLRGSIRTGATAYSAKVKIGRGLVYAKPVIFGWPGHNIMPDLFPYEVLDDSRGTAIELYEQAIVQAIQAAGE